MLLATWQNIQPTSSSLTKKGASTCFPPNHAPMPIRTPSIQQCIGCTELDMSYRGGYTRSCTYVQRQVHPSRTLPISSAARACCSNMKSLETLGPAKELAACLQDSGKFHSKGKTIESRSQQRWVEGRSVVLVRRSRKSSRTGQKTRECALCLCCWKKTQCNNPTTYA